MKISRVLLLLCGCAALLSAPADALDPNLEITQYKLTRWGIDEGAPRSVVTIAQGRDGYLWLGSAAGLYRFDGLTFEFISPPAAPLSRPNVNALLAARDGAVWVGYSAGVIAVFRNGSLRPVPIDSHDPVMSIVETTSGTVWAAIARNQNQLAVFTNSKWRPVGSAWGLPAGQPWTLLATRNGALWVSLRNDILVLKPGARRFERAVSVESGSALSEDQEGNVWISNAQGSWAIADRHNRTIPKPKHLYPTPSTKRLKKAVFDRDGNLWGVANPGIFRVMNPNVHGAASAALAADSVTRFETKVGFSMPNSTMIFEDREGDIWFATASDLYRLRPTNVVAEPTLTNRAKWGDPLLSAADGSVFIGEADGVYRIPAGGTPSLFLTGNEPQALCEAKDGTIWTVLQDSVVGLKDGRKTVLPGTGKTDMGISDCAVDDDGSLWLAAMQDGVIHWAGNRWERTLAPLPHEGLPPQTLVRTRRMGLVVGFSNGGVGTISSQGKLRLLVPRNSPAGSIRTMFEAGDDLLLGGEGGLMRLRNGRLDILSSKRFPMLISTSGIVQTPTGETWLRTAGGIVRAATLDLAKGFADPKHTPSFRVLDYRDGLVGPGSADVVRDAVQGADGRIWFGSAGGVVRVDPARQAHNHLPPPVSIPSLKAGDVTYRDPVNLRLPAGTANLAISFAAPSLSIPERVKVRYLLQGEDAGWIDPGARRQAFYTNLKPGDYVFRVIGANDDGVWNRSGATLRFSIAPTFLQSNWFVALCVLAGGLFLWWLYTLRLAQLMSQMKTRLEERERIARDLHDTLLQGFQGLVLRFQSIANEIPSDVQARGLLEQALDSADDVLEEGRNSVAQLRREGAPDLAQALMDTAERMRMDYPIEFKMTVEGTPRELHPVVRAELRRIGDEAVINAFQHSRATIIEIVVSYHTAALLMGIRDDGIGIDQEVVDDCGRQGHFGLVGMRERANQICADLKLSTRAASGTEIHVRVPARIAYNVGRRGSLGILLRRTWSSKRNLA